MMVFHREQRFSIRKFSVGAASVLIGITMAGQVVSAEELPTTQSNVVAPADSIEPKATEEVASSSPAQDKSTAEEASGVIVKQLHQLLHQQNLIQIFLSKIRYLKKMLLGKQKKEMILRRKQAYLLMHQRVKSQTVLMKSLPCAK
mgnify:CR=1 FL=1